MDFNSTDPFEIVSIFWHGNNEVGSSYVNQSHFQWKIPEYTMPDEQVQVKATIRFKNNAGDEVVATLTADIKILEKPFVPGHTITDLLRLFESCRKFD